MEVFKQIFRRLTTAFTILFMTFVLFKTGTDMYFCYLSGSTKHLTYLLMGAAFVLGCVIFLLAKQVLTSSDRTALTVSRAIFAAMAAVQIFLIFTIFRYYLPWADSLSVMNEAISMSACAHPSIESCGRYFEMYGNNYFFTILLCYYFKFFRLFGLTSYWMEGLFLNMAAMDLGVWFCLKATEACFGSQKRLILSILCLLNPLLYVFLPFVYTNTISIPFTMGIFCMPILFIRESGQKRRIFYAVTEGLLIAIGFRIRVTTLIPVIALALSAFFLNRTHIRIDYKSSRSCRMIPLLAFLAVLVLGFGSCRIIINHHVPKELRNSNFPVTHWLMMGLQGDGGYSSLDEDFTYSYATKEEKKEANLQEIRFRLGALADLGPAGVLNFIKEKITVTWASENDGLYLETGRMQGYSPLQKYLFGFKNDLMLYYYQFYKVMLLGLSLIALVHELIRKKGSITWLYGLTMLGFFAFYLLWEANCRYTICLTLLLTVLAFHGIDTLCMVRLPLPGQPLRKACGVFVFAGILLPCVYAMVCQYSTYTENFIPKVDYSIITVGRDYHENAVTGVASEQKTLTQTFTTSHPFNEVGIYCTYDDVEKWSESFLDEKIYRFRLLDSEGNVLAEETFGAEDNRKYYKYFGFDLVTPSGSSTYTIEITADTSAVDRLKFLYFDFDTWDYIEHADLSVNGESLDRDLIFLVDYGYSGPYTTPARYLAVCVALAVFLAALSAFLIWTGKKRPVTMNQKE